jgi:hypothetical protein
VRLIAQLTTTSRALRSFVHAWVDSSTGQLFCLQEWEALYAELDMWEEDVWESTLHSLTAA